MLSYFISISKMHLMCLTRQSERKINFLLLFVWVSNIFTLSHFVLHKKEREVSLTLQTAVPGGMQDVFRINTVTQRPKFIVFHFLLFFKLPYFSFKKDCTYSPIGGYFI